MAGPNPEFSQTDDNPTLPITTPMFAQDFIIHPTFVTTDSHANPFNMFKTGGPSTSHNIQPSEPENDEPEDPLPLQVLGQLYMVVQSLNSLEAKQFSPIQ